FVPNDIRTSDNAPPTKIETLIADGEAVDIISGAGRKETHRLAAGTKRLEFRYTGLSFIKSRQIKFKLKLEGDDNLWVEVGQSRSRTYTNLSPGDYTFMVKAANSDGTWDRQGDSISFYIKPYFYQTTWFYLLAILFSLLVTYSLYRFRVRKLKVRQEELEILVQERTKDLHKAKEAAERASRAKSRFLSNMSHEIRTPMNAILGFTEIMAGEVTDKKHKDFLQAVSSSGHTLLELINDILDLSKIEAGKMELQPEPINPRDLLNEVKFVFSNKLREKELDFRLEVDPDLPGTLYLDGLRMRQVLINLMGNAVKFTESGFIKLSAMSAGPVRTAPGEINDKSVMDVIFSVQDTGIGIPESQRERIFNAFEQQDGQSAAQFGGTGLGLAITRQLVGMMGGELSVQSVQGKGSTFSISLKHVRVPEEVAEDPNEIEIDTESVRFEPASLLVVDDKALNRSLLIEYLSGFSLDFIEAENGREALIMAKDNQPDLVLMDMKMPVMGGAEAIKQFKADDRLKQIPVIAITASALKEQQEEIKRTGADGHLNKPVNKTDLIIELMNFLPYCSVETTKTVSDEKAAENREDPIPEVITPEVREKRLTLLTILRGDEITGLCERVGSQFILHEIEEFAEEMIRLGRDYQSGILSTWAENLVKYVESFDIEKIQQSLSGFPGMVEEIENIMD
ncbi:MAG: response regulator, partial [bacterium]|nr:response regulator [bacterium]